MVWSDPEFRKSVVNAVRLKVETRNTKPEKILRLILYLWVRSLMVPSSMPQLPVLCDASHLYNLLCQRFGEGAVECHVKRAELSNYVADLATLGVLEKHAYGYAFRYKYFASLLYYDTFGGQLGDQEIADLWNSIVDHDDRLPRTEMWLGEDRSLSPFLRADQDRIED